MSACGHVSLASFAVLGVDYGVEEVGFAMLAAEILASTSASVAPERDGRRVDGLTLLMISSWSARCVLQFLQP